MNNYQNTLGQTYYYNSIFNPGANASLFLGNHGEIIKIILRDQGEIITNINRVANNGYVRIHPGNNWLNFLQNNFNLGDIMEFQVVNPNQINIL